MALEQSGFELRDCIYHLFAQDAQVQAFVDSLTREQQEAFWRLLLAQDDPYFLHLFGSGFPKSHDLSKAIDRLKKAKRDVIGQYRRPDGSAPRTAIMGTTGSHYGIHHGIEGDTPITAPATPEAQQWDGWGTALKPSCETWWLVRKPLSEKTLAHNVLKWGVGGINIDGCRVEYVSEQDAAPKDYSNSKGIGTLQEAYKEQGGRPYKDGFSYLKNDFVAQTHPTGRWPAHLLLSHSLWCVPNGTKRVKATSHNMSIPAVYHPSTGFTRNISEQTPYGYADEDGMETVEDWICDESCPVWLLDQQSGNRGNSYRSNCANHKIVTSGMFGGTNGAKPYNDQGGASRYFNQFYYCPKSSRKERNAGCEDLPARKTFDKNTSEQIAHINHATGETTYNDYHPSANQNSHPTVKPVELLKYLCRMICPPDGIVLDMFAGSASTALACIEEGFHFIMIEESDTEEEPYVSIARARVAHALQKKGGNA
jgi:site-specific DNA-methyltransferase (adenine-specific)